MLPRLLTALLVLALLAPAAQATHMRYYAQVFIEHDDQGRSDEPDGASTGVLGVPVRNCVVNLVLTPGCIPDSSLPAPAPGHSGVLAPGCTDDQGRQPSGLCGMWTVGLYHPEVNDPSLATPPGVAGVQGMSGTNAPGRFSATKSTTVRFLDIITTQQEFVPGTTGSHYIDLNHKLQDTGVSAALAGLDPNFGGKVMAGNVGIWAWRGTWADKNGNGVIDHLGDVNGNVRQDNEFKWVGKCIQFNGTPAPEGNEYCIEEKSSTFPVWIWPGNHHAFCGGTLPAPVPPEQSCNTLGADIPGHQLICFVDVLSGGQTPVFCDGSFATFDLTDEDALGDPLLGTQGHVWPDSNMGDRTGDINIGSRQWVYGSGWQTKFYDQSTLVSTIIVGGVTLQAFNPESRQRLPYNLGQFQDLDVDYYRTFSPVVEQLVQNQLKPALRGNWVTVRDNFIPVQNTTDGLRNNAALDTSAHTAPVDDAFINPGFSREPNTRFDAYPAALYRAYAPADPNVADGDEAHRGWLNDYAAHRDSWRAFADLTTSRMYHTNLVWRHPTSGNCLPQMCTSGGGIFSSNMLLAGLQPADQHRRTLEPGIHVVGGFLGAWQDRVQVLYDEVIDVEATLAAGQMVTERTDYAVGYDGWLGNIVNTTGTWKYRGYPGPSDAGAPTCTIAGVSATRYFAECNPYWNAVTLDASPYAGPFQDTGVDIENPQAGGGGEFAGVFPARSVTDQHKVRVYPAGSSGDCATQGTWTVPVFVWTNFVNWRIGDTGAIVDYTSSASAIVLDAGIGGGIGSPDVLVLPLGNQGLTVCTLLDEQVVVNIPERGINVNERVRDVDVYVPYA